MSYPIQKAGSASDIISKNQIQTQYANILSQQLAVEAGIQGKVTYVSGGAGASSTLISASKGNTIFTIAELRSVVNNIISNTATTEAQAAALASAANRKLGITAAAVTPPVVIIDDYSPVINLILEENTLNTGTTSATLSVTNTVPITFETKVGKLSGYFPGSILSYLSIPFDTIASGSFSVSYWFNPFDGGYYDPWSLSFLGTSGNDWGIQTDINPAGTQSYNIRMSVLQLQLLLSLQHMVAGTILQLQSVTLHHINLKHILMEYYKVGRQLEVDHLTQLMANIYLLVGRVVILEHIKVI
jgi:hypothetical protein